MGKKTKRSALWLWIIGSGGLAAVGLVAFGAFASSRYGADGASMAWWGAHGDALAPVIGVLNALALGAALASVYMQTQELAMQRREMRRARLAQEEMAREQKDAIAAQRLANRIALLREEVAITLAIGTITDRTNFQRAASGLKRLRSLRTELAGHPSESRNASDAPPGAPEIERVLAELLAQIDRLAIDATKPPDDAQTAGGGPVVARR